MPPQSHLSEYTVEIVCCLNVVCQSVTTNFKLFLILFHLLHVYLLLVLCISAEGVFVPWAGTKTSHYI